MNDDANQSGRDARSGEPATTAQPPERAARRLALSKPSLRAAVLGATFLGVGTIALYRWSPQRVAGPDLRIRALLDEVDRMALVVPGAEQSGLEPYFLDRFEVTNEQYARFLTDTGIRGEAPNPGVESGYRGVESQRPNHPVVFVSQPEAAAFAARSSKRLPTVLEWQYAAGLGASSGWDSVSRYRMNLLETGLGNSAQVGTFEGGRTRADDRISPAVYDLIGNVAEWCAAESPTVGLTPIAPVLGGSFNDSILDARSRFARDSSTIEDRNWALGFRCVRGDAESWLRRVVAEVSSQSGALRREHVERLRRFGQPLRRLIEKCRLSNAIERPLLPGNELDVSDRYLALEPGDFLRIHAAHVERIDATQGRISLTGDLGILRGFARTIRDVRGRRFLIAADARQRSGAASTWLTVDAAGQVELCDARLEIIPRAVATDSVVRNSRLPSLPVLTRFLPACMLTAPLGLQPIAIATESSDERVLEIDTSGSELTVRRGTRLIAADEVVVDVDSDVVFLRDSLTFEMPYGVVYALDFGEGATRIAALDLGSGELLSQIALAGPSIGMHCGDPRAPSILVVDEHGFERVDGLLTSAPRVTRVFTNEDEGFRITETIPFFAGDVLVEALDEHSEKSLLARIDSNGAVLDLRSLDTFDLRATRIAAVDADNIMLIGASDSLVCLDGRLRERWTARGAPYTFEFCPPVAIDLDGHGALEYAVPFGREGVFGIVFYDSRTGRETERLLTEGHHVLTLQEARPGMSTRGLIAGVRELGLLGLRAPSGPEEESLRRLEDELDRRGKDRAP